MPACRPRLGRCAWGGDLPGVAVHNVEVACTICVANTLPDNLLPVIAPARQTGLSLVRVDHLQVRQAPALAAHVACHDAEAFRLHLALPPDRVGVADVRAGDTISKRR